LLTECTAHMPRTCLSKNSAGMGLNASELEVVPSGGPRICSSGGGEVAGVCAGSVGEC
jgi:hypothetical protein